MPMLRLLLTLHLILLGSVLTAEPQIVTLDVDGTLRSFRYAAPEREGPMPVILSYHGYGRSAARHETLSGLTPMALRQGMIIVYPQGRKSRGGRRFWATRNGQDKRGDLAFTHAILDYLKAHHQIDPHRIFATGFSNGGGMAHVIATHMNGEIAAIAPVSGAYYDHQTELPKVPVPVLAFHGGRDWVVPLKGRGSLPDVHDWAGFWAARNGCAPSPAEQRSARGVTREVWGGCAAPVRMVTIEQGGHGWPGAPRNQRRSAGVHASREIVAFFAAQ